MTYPNAPQYYDQPPSLDAPRYGASFGEAVRLFFAKYATFSGRASRSEYWWVALLGLLVGILTAVVDVVLSGSFAAANANATGLGDILSYLWVLAVLVPSLAVSVRRLHDTNRSGWWILLGLVPLVGPIVLIVFYVSGPHPGGARFDKGTAPAGAYATPGRY